MKTAKYVFLCGAIGLALSAIVQSLWVFTHGGDLEFSVKIWVLTSGFVVGCVFGGALRVITLQLEDLARMKQNFSDILTIYGKCVDSTELERRFADQLTRHASECRIANTKLHALIHNGVIGIGLASTSPGSFDRLLQENKDALIYAEQRFLAIYDLGMRCRDMGVCRITISPSRDWTKHVPREDAVTRSAGGVGVEA